MVKIIWRHLSISLERTLHSPFGFQLASLCFLLLLVLSFRPPYYVGGQTFGGELFSDRQAQFSITEHGFLDNYAGIRATGVREVWVEQEDGTLVKKYQTLKRDSVVTYTVRSGDNISKIAHRFGLKVSTLLWANSLHPKATLRIGREIRIPPSDGVFYTVKAGDTLGDVIQQHGIEMEKVTVYNRLDKDGRLEIGQELFLPDAKKILVRTPSLDVTGASPQISSIGFRLRRPTQGVLTQGFHRRHYALDISNRLNTPIYSAGAGKVIKSESGWNYGYGTYVIIDHGNGVETLYAHMNARKVNEGDQIKVGQLVGLMGNTGNVWGPTGIHLHFELRINGRKVNPNNYF